jgi:NTE family protein
VPTATIAESVDAFVGPGWPDRPLWVCAVRLDDGELVVFGRSGSQPVGVGEAVAASCAIPGFFAPVDIDGVRYVDGGVSSLTNLSVVAGMNLDLVVVSAPMSSAGLRVPLASRTLARQAGRAQLDREMLKVRRRGIPVIAFHPTAEDQAVMGVNAMDGRRRAAVVRQARESTIRRLERADVRRRLSSLTEG